MGYWGDMPHNNLDLPRICLAAQASHWDKAPQLALSASVSGQWSTESMTRSDLYVVLKPVSVDVRQGSGELYGPTDKSILDSREGETHALVPLHVII